MKIAVYLYMVGALFVGNSFADFQKRKCNYSLGVTAFTAVLWPILLPVAFVFVSFGDEAKSPNKCGVT